MILCLLGFFEIGVKGLHIEAQYRDNGKDNIQDAKDNIQEEQHHGTTDSAKKSDTIEDFASKKTNREARIQPILPTPPMFYYPGPQLNDVQYSPSVPFVKSPSTHHQPPPHPNTYHDFRSQNQHTQNSSSVASAHPGASSAPIELSEPMSISSTVASAIMPSNNPGTYHMIPTIPALNDLSSFMVSKQLAGQFYRMPLYIPMAAMMPMIIASYVAPTNTPTVLPSSRPSINVPLPFYMNTIQTEPWQTLESTPKDAYHFEMPIRKLFL